MTYDPFTGGRQIGHTKIQIGLGSTAVAANTLTDLPNHFVTFYYTGRPVWVRVNATQLKYSVVNASFGLYLQDASGVGVATNGKTLYEANFSSAPVANQLFDCCFDTDPISGAVDVTAMVPGTLYNWKVQLFTPSAGNIQQVLAANSAFAATMTVFEA